MDISKFKNVDVRTVNRDTLVDRNTIKIDPSASKNDRLKSYIEQIGNPYCYKDGKIIVKISFANTDTTIEDCILNYLKGL